MIFLIVRNKFLLYFVTCTFFVIFWDLYIFCYILGLVHFLLYFGTCTFFVFVLVCFEFKMHLQISWAKLHFSPSPHPLPPFLYLFAFASAPLLLHGSRVRVAVSFGRICPGRCFSPVFLPFLPACVLLAGRAAVAGRGKKEKRGKNLPFLMAWLRVCLRTLVMWPEWLLLFCAWVDFVLRVTEKLVFSRSWDLS